MFNRHVGHRYNDAKRGDRLLQQCVGWRFGAVCGHTVALESDSAAIDNPAVDLANVTAADQRQFPVTGSHRDTGAFEYPPYETAVCLIEQGSTGGAVCDQTGVVLPGTEPTGVNLAEGRITPHNNAVWSMAVALILCVTTVCLLAKAKAGDYKIGRTRSSFHDPC